MPDQISITDALTEILAAATADNLFPDPDFLAYHQMLKERIIYIETDIDLCMLRIHKQIAMWNAEDRNIPVEHRKPIHVIIMSYGGYADYMWMVIDAIKMSKTPVYTYDIGVAHSSAALIFMAGHKRFMTPNARLMIHEGAAKLEGDAGKILDNTESYKQELKRSRDFITSQTQIPKTTLARKRANDWELGAQECLKYGVCDEIIDSMDDML